MKSRKQIRLPRFDYASVGRYFVTICTQDRICHFVKIVDSQINLTEIGENALAFWNEIPDHYPNVVLGEFVVMLNHIHGVINIFEPTRRVVACNDLTPGNDLTPSTDPTPPNIQMAVYSNEYNPNNGLEDVACNIPTVNENPHLNQWMSGISPKPGSLSAIIRSYKSAPTRWCSKNNHSQFAWQAKFHDRIIRNQEELDNIENYIILNPSRWDSDENHV